MSDPPPPTLIEAVRGLISVMRHRGTDLEATAARIETYDKQPYPLTYVIMSNHVTNVLRALAAAERGETTRVSGRPRAQYGPPRRDVTRG